MPRQARQLSESQIYHVMLRGNEKKSIFIDEEDKNRFRNTIFEKRAEEAFYLYAYCIMDNHVHIVIKEGKDVISRIIKRVATSYAYFFNRKYKRVGHVFQDRFKSENVEDERYLLSVIRYVHQNPEKAKISKMSEYEWSSYRNYENANENAGEMPEVKDILKLFSLEINHAVQSFIEFNSHFKQGNFIDVDDEETSEYKITEGNINDYIKSFLDSKDLEIKDLKKQVNREERNNLVRYLVKNSKLSKRRIAEVTGINRETVRELSKEPSP